MSQDLSQERRKQLISSISRFGATKSVTKEELHDLKKEVKSSISFPAHQSLEDLSDDRLAIVGLLKIVSAQEKFISKWEQQTSTRLASAFGVAGTGDLGETLSQLAHDFGLSDADDIGFGLRKKFRRLNQVIPTIAEDFGLSGEYDENSVGSLCNSIRKKFGREVNSLAFVSRVAAVLGLPSDSTEDEIVAHLQTIREDTTFAEDEVVEMKQTISGLKKQVKKMRGDSSPDDKLRKSLEKIKKANAKLEQHVQEVESDKATWEEKCKDLEAKIDASEQEKAELEGRLIALRAQVMKSPETKDLDNIMKLADQLKRQFENQSEELMDESRIRKQLVEIVKKQTALTKAYEDQVRKVNHELAEVRQGIQIDAEQRALQSLSGSFDEEELRTLLLDIVAYAPPKLGQLLNECMRESNANNETIFQVIEKMFEVLIKETKTDTEDELVNQNKQAQEQIQRLMSALDGELKFMEKLVESEEQRKALINEDQQSAKDMLVMQSVRLHKFMEEYCTGIIEDHSVFNMLKIDKDPMELRTELQNFLDRYKNLKTDEGNELFLLLRQSFVVIAVLMSFATEARKQCSVQMREIRLLRQDIVSTRTDCEREIDEKILELHDELNAETARREAAEAAVEKVTTILKDNVGKSGTIPEILSCIDQLEGFTGRGPNPEKYEKSLERQLADALNELSQAQSQLSGLKEQASTEISQMHERSEGIQEETKAVLESKNAEIQDARLEIMTLRHNVKELKEELRLSYEENQAQSQKISELKASYAKKNSEMQQEFVALKQKMVEMIEETEQDIVSREKEKRSVLKQKLKKAKENSQSLSSLLEEKEQKLKAVSTMNSQLMAEKRDRVQASRDLENEYQQSIATMREQLRQATAKQMSTELENKVLNSKLRAVEDKSLRAKSAMESKSSLNMFSFQSELHSQTESLRDQFLDERNQLLVDITHCLASFWTPSTSALDEKTVLKGVKATVEILKQTQKEKTALEKEQRELRRIVKCPMGVNPLEIVSQLSEHLRVASAKLERFNSEMQSMPRLQAKPQPDDAGKEWEDWARHLYSLVTDGLPNILPVTAIKASIEEAALASTGKDVARKLESLRIQKQLLMGVALPHRCANRTSLRKLVLTVMGIQRMLKQSGSKPADMSFERIESPVPQSPLSDSPPIFSSFIE